MTAPVPGMVSVILPCYNEAENVVPLVEEICAALASLPSFEVVCVDDGSTDATARVLSELAAREPRVQVLHHLRNYGQSAGQATGFRAARGAVLVTMDSDGQNDPADVPRLLEALEDPDVDAVCGVRRERHDTWVRKVSSRIGNGFRNLVTGDSVRDAGCALRALRREALAEIPVFNGLHRFLPTLLRIQGFRVVEVEVDHRPRRRGVSKYGIRNRMFRGILDCLAILWWRARAVPGRRLR